MLCIKRVCKVKIRRRSNGQQPGPTRLAHKPGVVFLDLVSMAFCYVRASENKSRTPAMVDLGVEIEGGPLGAALCRAAVLPHAASPPRPAVPRSAPPCLATPRSGRGAQEKMSIVPSKTTKRTVLDNSSKAKEILCKPVKGTQRPIDPRGLDCSSFLITDQWTDTFFDFVSLLQKCKGSTQAYPGILNITKSKESTSHFDACSLICHACKRICKDKKTGVVPLASSHE